ncbi:MAG: hypothetical protein NVS9B10_26860 [Nevskia sp.]
MIRSCLFFIFATMAGGPAAQAADAELNALLTHESVNHRTDGVTETYRYQERLVRFDDAVWLERVLPPAGSTVAQPGTAGDHGPNLQILPRWIRRGPDGAASLTLVDRTARFTVPVKIIEYGRLGFSGDWAAESNLVAPASLKTMKLSARASDQAGARWYEASRKGRYSRVLWSDRLQFPLVIETGSEDGHSSSRTTVQVEAVPKTRPWTGLEGFLEHEIDDFGD